ncbi:MAG: asparagine synthase (glutamine-hydrolyzing) [Candidatus Omnitrophica bacterium]|nr:asparagine synthase (glutamine-hydrolyzing) [Candidatus Omnitrophota bacterium]
MCGICGIIDPNGFKSDLIKRMNQLASHRGPDGEGYWFLKDSLGSQILCLGGFNVDGKAILGLGHRRLAILDLSPAGLQPMSGQDKKVWIVFNGEIYNYLELKKELSDLNFNFETATDTEVILKAYQCWGTDCFRRFNGMWAIVLVDLSKRCLILSRDRLGIKPLYYFNKGNKFAFASEIKQFFALEDIRAKANLNAIIEYIDTGYDHAPDTFFQDIKAFPAGSWARFPIEELSELKSNSFWFPDAVEASLLSRGNARDRLKSLFEDSVSLRLRSDVPVGVCLSGGLDSSSIYGQLQRLKPNSAASLHSFSAVFDDRRFDERKYIEIVVNAFAGITHYAFPKPEGFIEEFDNFIYHHDEPPGSLIQYAGWVVMRMVRDNNVPVLLNGQGGDELFSGYWPAYYLFLAQAKYFFIFRALKHFISSILPGGNPSLVGQLPAYLHRYLFRKERKGREVLLPEQKARGLSLKKNWVLAAQNISPFEYRMQEITRIHLPRLLKWEDRNAMAFGIEARFPFLDHRLVEFAVSLPAGMNLQRGWNKLLIRESFADILPEAIRWRRSKIGFEIPQTEWMRNELRPEFEKWQDRPAGQLRDIIDTRIFFALVKKMTRIKKLHRMNEWQKLIVRIFLLDRWFKRFNVDL